MGFDIVLDYLNRSLVPQRPLRAAMRWWGGKLGTAYIAGPLFGVMLAVLVVISAVGIPKINVETLRQSDWSPTGGEMEQQLKLMDELKPTGVQSFKTFLIMVGSKNGENLLDNPKKWLGYLEEVFVRVHNRTRVTASDGRVLAWDDLCAGLNHPLINMLAGGAETPCINPSPLDAFKEGAWQYRQKPRTIKAVQTIETTACMVGGEAMCGLSRNQLKQKSFMNLTDDEIIDKLSFDSKHWLEPSSNDIGINFGNYAVDSKGRLTHVETFNMWALQADAQLIIHNRDSVKNMTKEQFTDTNEEWLLELEKHLSEADADEASFPGAEILFYPSNAMARMYAEVAAGQLKSFAVGYGVMLVYVVVSQFSLKFPFLSVVAFAGFLIVVLANLAAYGLAALVGIDFNHTMTQALPFLALGLGVDDLFVLLHRFRDQLGKTVNQPDIIGGMMDEGGAAVTITSMCNAFVFLVGFTVPIPALRSFLTGAVVIVAVNWLVAMTMIPAICSLMVLMWRSCCRRSDRAGKEAPAEGSVDESEMEAISQTGAISKIVFSLYGLLARSLVGKLLCLVLGLVLLVVCSIQVPKVEMGFDYTDMAKEGTFLARGIDKVWAVIYSQTLTQLFVYGPGNDFSTQQKEMVIVNHKLKTSQWAADDMDFLKSGFLEGMVSSPGVCPNQISTYLPEINQTAQLCPPEDFYAQYHLWRKPAIMLPSGVMSFGSLTSQFRFVQHFAYSTNDTDYTPDNRILLGFDPMGLKMKKLKTAKDYIQMIKDLKGICRTSGLDIFMAGWTTVQYEQFLELETVFWKTFAISVAVIFGVSLLLGLTVLGAILMSFFSAALTLELYGCMALFDLRFQALLATSTLMALGMAVEFTAHPIAAYDYASGTRDQRLVKAMQKAAVPVLEGAISSFVGYLMLLFSDFPYVRKYFFTIYMLMIGLGCFNGLVLLPAVLGLLGRAKKASRFSVVQEAEVERRMTDKADREAAMAEQAEAPNACEPNGEESKTEELKAEVSDAKGQKAEEDPGRWESEMTI